VIGGRADHVGVHTASEPQSIDDTLPTAVHDVLATYLAAKRAGLTSVEPSSGPAVDALTDFVLGGGKRIRPTFAWWGWRGAGGAAGGDQAEKVLTAISALELIQGCALVHDDLMDDSALRRGKPTVHVDFAARHRAAGWDGDPDKFGAAAAILIGDLALAWADDLFSEAGLTVEQLAAAGSAWRCMRAEMLAGQYLDVLTQSAGGADLPPAEAAMRVARLKTAAYTVERPLHLGAALAGADEQTIGALRAFGGDIGVAFQLRDDLLGMFGDTAVTGKPAGDDLREGKRTLLIAVAVAKAEDAGRDADVELIHDALGNPKLSADDLDRVRDALVELDAVAEVESRIERLTGTALAALDSAELAEPAGQRLAGLAHIATRRSY
jgi:geranylgeranyl diphosphate synthase, type I